MTLREFGRVVWFNRWLVVLTTVLVTVLAYVYAAHREPTFSAVAEVEFASSDSLSSAGIRLDPDPAVLTATATQRTALADVGAEKAATLLGVTGGFGANPSQVTVTATSTTPQGAVALANAFAKAYLAHLQKQFDDGSDKLESRRDQLGDWLKAHPIPSDESSSSANGVLQAQYTSTMSQYQALLMQIANASVLPSVGDIRRNAVGAIETSVPTRTLVIVAGLMGLFLGLGGAVVRNSLDTKVRSASSVRRAGVRVLAVVVAVGAAERKTRAGETMPVAQRVAVPFTQTMRELRTTLQAALPDGGVVVVTSIEASSTCSFLTANLAASFALSDRRVVALSGDLRQPRLQRYLPVAGDPEGDPSTIGTDVVNLRVAAPLHTRLDPADYLAKDQVRQLIERLRAGADVVVVDTPPVLAAADASILGAYADGVVLMVRQGTTTLGAIEEAAQRLEAAGAPLLGVVVVTERAARRRHATSYAFAGDESDDEPTADARTADASAGASRTADAGRAADDQTSGKDTVPAQVVATTRRARMRSADNDSVTSMPSPRWTVTESQAPAEPDPEPELEAGSPSQSESESQPEPIPAHGA